MVVFNIIIFLIVMSHLRSVLSDPGTVPLPKTSLDFSDMHAGQKMSKVKYHCVFSRPTCIVWDTSSSSIINYVFIN